jgi:hypothetical protein
MQEHNAQEAQTSIALLLQENKTIGSQNILRIKKSYSRKPK